MERIGNIERFAVQRACSMGSETLHAEGTQMLLRKVEKFLRDHDMPATKFARLAAHDPRFVLDLRLGRIPRAKTEARTLRWMAEYEASRGIAATCSAARDRWSDAGSAS